MSIVNVKVIFVKKEKQTRGRPTQGRGGGSFITEMAVHTWRIIRVRWVIRLISRQIVKGLCNNYLDGRREGGV